MSEDNLSELEKMNLRLDGFYKDVFHTLEDNKKDHLKAHEELADQIEAVSEQNKRQFKMLEPIAKTYDTANTIKKIAYATIIALGTTAGSFLSLREVYKIFKK